MNKNIFSTSTLTVCAIIAALYVVLTLGFSGLGYNMVQFRIAEVLNLMAFINPVYGVGVVLGCLISNMFSPLGIIDVVFGTFATALAVFFIAKSPNLFIATLWPTIFSSLIVGYELTYLYQTPFLVNFASVAIGQFVVCTIVGFPLFKTILKNKFFLRLFNNPFNTH